MSQPSEFHFISDLVLLYLENLQWAAAELKKANPADQDYLRGQLFAWYDALTLLRDQADAFDLVLPCLEGVDLEGFLKE